MKKLLIIVLALSFIGGLALWRADNADAVICFLSWSYVSGMNQVCIYDCCGSDAAITVESWQLCPLTINR